MVNLVVDVFVDVSAALVTTAFSDVISLLDTLVDIVASSTSLSISVT